VSTTNFPEGGRGHVWRRPRCGPETNFKMEFQIKYGMSLLSYFILNRRLARDPIEGGGVGTLGQIVDQVRRRGAGLLWITIDAG
jgi:hypothetical protein